MHLSQLRALVAVADYGSFVDAASALSVTQSAVSHAIGSLEQELDARLVARGRSGSTLTAIGHDVLPHAREVLRRVEMIVDDVAPTPRSVGGPLRIGTFPSTTQLLTAQLTVLRRRYPAVRPILLEGSDAEVIEWIQRGVVELGVAAEATPSLRNVPLTSDEFVVVIRDDHPLAGLEAIDIADLADDQLIISTGGCEQLISQIYRRREVPFSPLHRVRDIDTVLSMIRGGFGVSIVPTLSLARPTPSRLTSRPLDPPARRSLYLAFPTDATLSAAAGALLEGMAVDRTT